MHKIETKIHYIFMYKLAFALMAMACQFALTSAAFAVTDSTDAEAEYVDSVYSWGIWELGLEPASGPEVAASNAMIDRSRNLKFRPNDNAAYINPTIPVPQSVPASTVPAPIPVISVGGTGPIIPGMVPNPSNLR